MQNEEVSPASHEANWLSGGGEMGQLIRETDWSRTSLGAMEFWSPSLRMMVRFLLANRFPMLLWWGPQFIQIYNDAYRPVLGAKHPNPGLARPVSECWSEIWHILQPLIETPFNGGPATWMEDIPLEINRYGFVEETHFTIAYSPVPDETVPNGIGGVLATVHEISEKVVGQRRIDLLRDLSTRAVEAKSAEEACGVAATTLIKHPLDIPFALLYLIDADRQRAHLAGTSGIVEQSVINPQVVEFGEQTARTPTWPLGLVLETEGLQVIEDLAGHFGAAAPPGPWSDPPRQAVIAPIRSNTPHQLAGLLIVGVSARLRLDDPYRSFIELAAAQISTAIANARAHEEERKRVTALAELDRAKTTFFSNVSHEFRTPLTLMLGPLEDAMQGQNDTSSLDREQLALVHGNGLRLLKLVNTLLDFSRIEAGRAEAVYEPVDLAAYTSELASVFRSAIEKAGVRLVVDCPPLDEAVYVDRQMWEKILFNLLSNAFKFTMEGEIAVTLRRTGDQAELRVRDTGLGIPTSELPHIFERFHRVQGAQGRAYEGTGIGLALVQELVRLHCGSVNVESEYAKGSVFVVSLPMGTAHLPPDRIGSARTMVSTSIGAAAYVEEALRWRPEQPDAGFGIQYGERHTEAEPVTLSNFRNAHTRIVLADDNADMRGYVARLLTQNGYQVETVADGKAALEIIRSPSKGLPSLILTDVMMPRLDGFGLLTEIRNDKRTKEIPVIMLSARAGEEAKVEGLAAGADDYLIKPFSARELLARVEAHLQLQRVRREAETALRESEEKLRAFINATSDVIYEMSADWRVMRFLDGKGYIATTKTSRSDWTEEYIPETEKQRVWAAIHQAVLTKSNFELEHQIIRLDGTTGWTFSRAVPLLDKQGDIREWFGTASDVTVRKRAEEDIQTANYRFRLAEEAARGFTYDWNIATGEVTRSESLFRVLGYQPEELEPTWQGWVDLLHPADLFVKSEAEAIEYLRQLKEETFGREFRARHKRGHYCWLMERAQLIRNEDGNPRRMIGQTVDITERKEAQEKLLAAEQQLRVEAEAASRAKDEFLALVSHELRSPLNAMLGYARLLRVQQPNDPSIIKATEVIQRNGRAQLQLIEDLLDTARIISGKLKLELGPVELTEIITAALDTVRLAAERKSIQLDVMVKGEDYQITGDADRLQQIIWNLLSNAIKFTPEGGHVRVTLSRQDSALEVKVSDTGTGISPDLLPYIFHRFKQGDSSASRRFGGLGLGLSLVKHLIELHGGSVEVESAGPGQGATFIVRMPERAVSRQMRTGPVQPILPRSVMAVSSHRLDGVRVLVVDDEEEARELVARTLQQYGAFVTAVDSATAALFALETQSAEAPFDVLLSDIAMPGTDGYELMRQVRAHPNEKVSLIPAVALTAYGRPEDRLRALEAGFRTYVAKPVEEGELTTVIASVTGRLRVGASHNANS